MSFTELLGKVLTLEAENAKAIKAKLTEALEANTKLQEQIADLVAQDVIDQANAAQLTAATQTLEARLGELEALNLNPGGDSVAQEIIESEIDTPAEIAEDPAIGGSDLTSDEAIAAIVETFPELVEVAEGEDEITEEGTVETL
jgi:hypothetical protein